MLNVAIYGASGYGGVELLRLLLSHPDVTVRQATSREAGRRIDAVHPGLRGLTDLTLSESSPAALDRDLDAVFFALPHGESAAIAEAVRQRCGKARLFDLAQDYRTGHEPAGWVYGLPELFREKIKTARNVACPGCFATSILLATAPAIASGHRPNRIIVDAKTGSSGSGASPQSLTHHPTRVATIKAYKVFEHQHETEIRAAWRAISGGRESQTTEIVFVPQSTPLVRGIYACCYLLTDRSDQAASDEMTTVYRDFYAGSPFVRILDEPPNVAHVRGTNNAELFLKSTHGIGLVIAAIDNLVKGAAGQAVQCMNLAFGLPEDRGLRLAALVP